MKHLSRFGACGLLTLVVSSCGVDQRPLTFEYHALDTAGSAAAAGTSVAAASGPFGGMPGAGQPSAGGDSACANCAGETEAGAATELGGRAGTDNGGGAGSANTGGASVTSNAGGPAAGAGTAGGAAQAGGAPSFSCGDLNQDSVDDCQQTLVLNSRFDAAVSNWLLEPSTTQAWNANDASGKTGSGSLQVENALPAVQAIGATTAGSHQCIPVTPTSNYDFAAQVLIAEGQAGGEAGITVWLFDDDSCNGNIVTGAIPISGGVSGSWTALKGQLWVPGGVHSMYVRLVAIKPFVQPSLKVFIDDVLVAKR